MKIFAALLAVVMVMALVTVPAFAVGDDDDTTTQGTITVQVSDPNGTHSFAAYQIFKGTLTDQTMTGVEWGAGITTDGTTRAALYDALKAITVTIENETVYPFTKDGAGGTAVALTTAAAVADVLTAYVNNSEVALEFQKVIAAATDGTFTYLVGTGTSLQQQTDKSLYKETVEEGYYLIVDSVDGDATNGSKAMLQVIPGKNNVITAKQDNVPSVTKYAGEEDKADNASYTVGDEIPYTIIGTTKNYDPNNTEDNYTYSYKFVDTMGKALSLVGTFSGANSIQVTSGVTVELVNGETATDITDKFNTTENPITYVENENGEHVLTISAANLKGLDGLTTASQIRVSYKARLNENVSESALVKNTVTLTIGEETYTPSQEGVFPLTLEITKTDGATGAPITTDTAEFRLYRMNADGTKEYAEFTEHGHIESWTTNPTVAATVKTNVDNGQLKMIGLGSGTFYLEETKAPEGYNKIDDLKLTITAETEETETGLAMKSLTYTLGDNGKAITVDPEYDENNNLTTDKPNLAKGIVPITVENNQGAQLPSTGGIGTTIFYVLGGVLIVGAVVLLVTRKRMREE